jgi:peptidoglycan/LPS O-acetylase OafA/YrhL
MTALAGVDDPASRGAGSGAAAVSVGARLSFVDGLRGIAALVVAVGHIIGMVPPDHPSTDFAAADWGQRLMWPWLFGGPMVWMFILLSGFALTWSEDGRVLRGLARTSPWLFARRRAWRILPTYYVSLALGLVVTVGLGRFLTAPSPSLSTYGPVTPAGVLAHLGLFHNLAPQWTHQINPPLWSIAIEVQLYLLFPLLAWAAIRWRPYAPAIVLLLLAKLVNHFSPVPLLGFITWFVAGAVLAHFIRRHPLRRLPLLSVAAVALTYGIYEGPGRTTTQVGQAVWLLGLAALVAGLVGAPAGGLNVPTWRPAVILGQRSYSLYVVHFPLALLLWAGVSHLHLPTAPAVVVMVAVGVPLALGAASVCYRLVEEPSLRRLSRVTVKATNER